MKRVRKAAGKPLGQTSVFDLILRGTPVGICNCSYTYTHTHTHTQQYRHLYTQPCRDPPVQTPVYTTL